MSVKQILLLFFANRNFILDLVSRLKQIFCRLFPPEMRKNESECPRSVNFFLYNLDNDVFMVFHFKNRPRKKTIKIKEKIKTAKNKFRNGFKTFLDESFIFFTLSQISVWKKFAPERLRLDFFWLKVGL